MHLRRDKGFLGLTGGRYMADIALGLTAENIATAAGGAVTAPLPVIGLRGEYYFTD